jgi:hypothetical protein
MQINKKLTEASILAEYQADMSYTYFQHLPAGECLQRICEKAKRCSIEKVNQRPIQLWTPFTGIMLIRLQLNKDLIKCALRPPIWRSSYTETLLKFAMTKAESVGKDGASCWAKSLESPTLLSPGQLRYATNHGDIESLRRDSLEVSRLLHGRRRQQRLDAIRERIGIIINDKFIFFKTMGRQRQTTD